MSNLGKVIGFEGIDRSGKSSAVVYVQKKLEEIGYSVISVNSKFVAGNRVPAMVGCYPDEVVYMFWWQAIRMTDLTVILPALEEGKTVLSDRGVLSNLAYSWDSLDYDFRKRIGDIYFKRCELPDLTLIFEVSFEKFKERDDGSPAFTAEKFGAISQNYRYWGDKLAQTGKEVVFIDGTRKVNVVHEEVFQIIKVFLEEDLSG